jgi:hypothetical protein
MNVFLQIIHRPVIKETVFMPDRKPPPLIHTRDTYQVNHYTNMNLYLSENIDFA